MVVAIVLAVALLAAGLLVARLTQGPLSVSDLGWRIAAALDRKVGAGYAFTLGRTSIQAGAKGLALNIRGLALRDAAGRPVIVAPRAKVWLDPLSLLIGHIRPRRLDIFDVDVRLSVLPEGSLAVSAGSHPIVLLRPIGARAVRPASEPIEATRDDVRVPPMQQVANALTRLLDVVTRGNSLFGGLKRVGIAHGRLVFDDRTRDETTVFSAFELNYEKVRDRIDLRIAADGNHGRWQFAAQAQGAAGGRRSVDFELRNVSLDQIALMGGLRDLGFDFDMPISTELHFGLDARGNLAQASGQFAFGSGSFRIDDPDDPPMRVDAITGGFHWDAEARRIVFEPTEFVSGQTHFEVNATLAAPRVAGAGWRVDAGTAPGGVVGAERPGETPIAFFAHLTGQIFPGRHKLAIDHLDLSGPQGKFAMRGELDWGGEAHTRIKLAAHASGVPMRVLIPLWPSFVAVPVRAWFRQHMLAGTLEKGTLAVDFSGADLAAMRAHRPIPPASTEVDFILKGATATFLPGVPALSGVAGRGRVTGRTASFTATGGFLEEAGGRRLILTDGSLQVADTSLKLAPASIDAHVLGGLDAVADVLSYDALKNIVGDLPIDTATVKGQVDARLFVNLDIGKDAPPDNASVRALATVSNFSVADLLAKESLQQGVLTVAFDHSALHAHGSGRMFGAPATIELNKPASGVTVATVGVILDDAARTKLGWAFGPALAGPIGARFVSALGQGAATHAQVELDFTHAAIEDLLPGYVKPAGRPAKATFAVTSDATGIRIDRFVFDGGTASARGSARFDPHGNFVAAHLSSLRLSPGDNMKVAIDQVKNVTKLKVRGTAVDVRPFLALIRTPGAQSDSTPAKDFDLDFKSPLVTGYDRRSMTGVELHVVRRGGVVQQFKLSGRMGREAVRAVTVHPRDGGPAQIDLSASDAGAFLAFIGLYHRMEGGRLQMVLRLGDGRVGGRLSVHNFILRDEPAIRRLVTEGVPKRDKLGDRVVVKIDPTAAKFTKLQVAFVRTGGRLEIRNGLMFSPQIGTKLEGWLDFAHDRVNMRGTFVPVYGLNDLFSQIPLFGPILGGGAHEGLFAVNFRISGRASAPVLSINPLSAIAPGFLRKIFGAIDFGPSPSPPADWNAPLSQVPSR